MNEPRWMAQLQRSEGLMHTKAGDVLCLRNRPELADVRGEPDLLFRVTAMQVTKTRITVAHDGESMGFYRSGSPVTRRHHGMFWIEPFTTETKEIATRQDCVRRARRVVFKLRNTPITDEQAIEIASAIIKAMGGES